MDDSSPPPDDPHTYVPTATPGCRAPHLWLNQDQSIFDILGLEFTLLQFNRDKDPRPIMKAAQLTGVPVSLVQIDNEEAREIYATDLVLIRPDQHIAWRSDSSPPDPEALLRKVSSRL